MNFINTRKFLAILTMMITVIAVPNTASARGSLHIELPHLSLGLHGGHHNKYRNRHHSSRYNNHRNYNNYYSNQNSHYGSGYKTYRYYQPQTRYYQSQPRYSQPRYNQPSYQNQSGYCPTPGYSSRYYNGGGCYEHGDHYHCDQ